MRQRLLTENKFGKYLLYALGEIVLVVIGILFALQISTWNSERIAQSTIWIYFDRMYVEIESEIKEVEKPLFSEERLRLMNESTLAILESNGQDSIPATDFESLYNNLERWNVVTVKLETLNRNIQSYNGPNVLLKELNAQIRKTTNPILKTNV